MPRVCPGGEGGAWAVLELTSTLNGDNKKQIKIAKSKYSDKCIIIPENFHTPPTMGIGISCLGGEGFGKAKKKI